MEDRTKEALRLLGIYTAGRYDIYALAGNAKAGCRTHIMSVLHGKRMPQSKSGITTMKNEFYLRAKIADGCGAEREHNFRQWAKDNNR